MDLSAEKLVNKALAQVVVSRSVVTALSTIGMGIKTIGHGIQVVGSGVEMLGNTAFTVEADGARKYENLTGVDLGLTVGLPNRYLGIHRGDAAPEQEPQR